MEEDGFFDRKSNDGIDGAVMCVRDEQTDEQTRKFTVGDRVECVAHEDEDQYGKRGIVMSVDSHGDPKVQYDGESDAKQKHGNQFRIVANGAFWHEHALALV